MADLVSLTQNLVIALRLDVSRVFLFRRQFTNFEAVLEALVPLLQSGDFDQEPYRLFRLQLELSSLFTLVTNFLIPPGQKGSSAHDLLKAAAYSHLETLRKHVEAAMANVVSVLIGLGLGNSRLDDAIRSFYDPTTRAEEEEREMTLAAEEFKALLGSLRESEENFVLASRKLEAVEAGFHELAERTPEAAFFDYYVTSITDTLLYEVLHEAAELDAEGDNIKFKKAADQLEECFGSLGTINKKRCRVSIVEDGLSTAKLADIIRRRNFISSVEHPNIARYLGTFVQEEALYVVEKVIGPSLHQVRIIMLSRVALWYVENLA